MSLTSLANSLKQALNRANLQSLTKIFGIIRLGDVMRAQVTTKYATAPSATGSPYAPAATHSVLLPDDAKARVLSSAYARAGTGTKGLLTVDNGGAPTATAPAAGHVAICPSGDVTFAPADAWTSVDVIYAPKSQDLVEETLPVATNSATLPTTFGLVTEALEIESLVGTLVAKMHILAPGAAVVTGQAALAADKKSVTFAAADAVTSARIKFGVQPAADLDALLEAQADVL